MPTPAHNHPLHPLDATPLTDITNGQGVTNPSHTCKKQQVPDTDAKHSSLYTDPSGLGTLHTTKTDSTGVTSLFGSPWHGGSGSVGAKRQACTAGLLEGSKDNKVNCSRVPKQPALLLQCPPSTQPATNVLWMYFKRMTTQQMMVCESNLAVTMWHGQQL